MSKTSMISIASWAFALATCALPHPAMATVLTNDLGDLDDLDPASDIYLERHAYCGGVPGLSCDDTSSFLLHQETPTQYWLWSAAPSSPDLIKARIQTMGNYIYVNTTAFNPGATKYLAIRYKDNLPTVQAHLSWRGPTDPPVELGPVTVYASGTSGFTSIGAIGGANDHAWKVAVLEVPPGQLAVTEGHFRFRIGLMYEAGPTGHMPIDRIQIADSIAELTIEPDMPGYYPADTTPFADLDKDSPWYVDGRPFFPVGLAAGWNGIGTEAGDFQAIADLGFNTLVFYNWTADPGLIPQIWTTMPSTGQFGFAEFLDGCAAAGLQAIGVFQEDVRYHAMTSYFGTESAALSFFTSVASTHKDHPALLAWSPADEPDHGDVPYYFSTVEWVLDVRDALRAGDPQHPIYSLEIGNYGAFAHFKDTGDYKGFDVYPSFGSTLGWIGASAEDVVSGTGGDKPFIAYLQAFDRTPEQAFMSYGEAYAALVHGANGIFYWSYYNGASNLPTLSVIAQEIDTLAGPALLPPATTLDTKGAHGLCTNTLANQIQNRFIQGSDGARYVLAANIENTEASDVQFTVAGGADASVEVLFESRTISMVDGHFTDSFPAYGRHVYVLPATTSIMTIDDATAGEGTSGDTTVTFTVTVTSPVSGPPAVDDMQRP